MLMYFILAPSSSPTDVQVTEVDGFTSVSWIYDINDADGYAVYFKAAQ